jgi:hypothetical protein
VTGSGDDSIPLRESIPLAIYANEPDDDGSKGPIHFASHPLHEGRNEVRIQVAERPVVATIDPFLTRVDRNRFDNEQDVQ